MIGRKFLISFVIAVFLSPGVYSISYACEPAIDCELLGIGALVPDPENCNNYYVCVNSGGNSVPSSVPLSCPSSQYFDQATGSCQVETTPCTNSCYKICTLTCDHTLEFIAFPGNCSKYYTCLPGGEKLTGDCPTNKPYFNGTECVDDQYQCCDSCVAYCNTAFTQIADPYDCTKFYICLSTGVAGEATHEQCPTGQYFDPETLTCVIGINCSPLCSGTSRTARYEKYLLFLNKPAEY